ncbi:MAG: hypothetical protein IIU15_06895 [Treponema sp.]|nr:hypothetical protein [Treponema sp.]
MAENVDVTVVEEVLDENVVEAIEPVESVADETVPEPSVVESSEIREESSVENAVGETDAVENDVAEDSEEKQDGEVKVDMELLQILNAQNDVLDCMLTQQKKIHDSVRDRRWTDLEESIENMRAYSDAFVNLDQCRENYVGDNRTLYLEPVIQEVYVNVRTKLSRSKIENSALATYVSSTKEFVDGVIENCVPQSRAKVYGRNGKIMSPTAESVVLDALV